MAYEGGHKERTRRRLLAEAASVLRVEGPERVSVAAIMARAGLTHGGFYAHFKSKDDLIVHAIDEMFAQAAAWFANSTDGLPPGEAIDRYVEVYLSAEHIAAPGNGCALPAIAGDVARLSPRAREHFSAGLEDLQGTMMGHLRGLVQSPDRASELATSLLSELSGATSLARAAASPELAKQICKHSLSSIRRRLAFELDFR